MVLNIYVVLSDYYLPKKTVFIAIILYQATNYYIYYFNRYYNSCTSGTFLLYLPPCLQMPPKCVKIVVVS